MKLYFEKQSKSSNLRVPLHEVGLNGVHYNIPVKAWIYHEFPRVIRYYAYEAEHYINEVNQLLRFKGVDIQLYLEEVEYQANATYFRPTRSEASSMMRANYEPFYMNIHFVHEFSSTLSTGEGIGGLGVLPDRSNRYSFAVKTDAGSPLVHR